jgi:hypothetical protein
VHPYHHGQKIVVLLRCIRGGCFLSAGPFLYARDEGLRTRLKLISGPTLSTV